MGNDTDAFMKRFIRAVNDGLDLRKLHSMLAMVPKETFMAWRDEQGQDALHYAVLACNAEAVDLLLKLGYFSAPYEPQVNMYAHLAARLGFRSVLNAILYHRPMDFKVVQQPLFIRHGFVTGKRSSTGRESRESDLYKPAVVGNQVYMEKTRKSSDKGHTGYGLELLTQGHNISNRVRQSGDRSNSLQQLEPIDLVKQSTGASKRPSLFYCGKSSIDAKSSLELVGPRRLSTSPRKSSEYQKRRYSSPEESNFFEMDGSSMSKPKPMNCTPLEIAARSKHVDCVKMLLDMYFLRGQSQKVHKGYLTLAALASDAPSLKLLMQSASSSKTGSTAFKDDFRMAVEVCVQNIFPQCLEFLLDFDYMEAKQVFKQINFFHVLYSQPSATYQQTACINRLPAMTELLIKRGQNVKAKLPPRTYPLYSLIDSALSCHEFTFSDCFLTCMKLLIANGADPNFDETEFEGQLASRSVGSRFYGGRHGFSSALHCVIQCLDFYHDQYHSMAQAIHFVEESMDVLIAHNADIEKMGRIGVEKSSVTGDVLCQFANSSVTMGLDRGLLHALTRFGAQPQRKIKDQYALNVYLDRLCAILNTNVNEARDIYMKYKRDLDQMITLMCAYMAPWHIKDVRNIFNFTHRKCTGEIQNMFRDEVNEALEAQNRQVHRLRDITAWQVWKLCKRKAANIKKLPVPKQIKTHVLPLLLFQTLW